MTKQEHLDRLFKRLGRIHPRSENEQRLFDVLKGIIDLLKDEL
jgi:hypothetical protein